MSYYPSKKEGKILGKFIVQQYKSAYEALKRLCKHKIMVGHGEQYAIIARLKEHTLNTTDKSSLPLNMEFEICIILSSELPEYDDKAGLYGQPILLYQPDSAQCKTWAESPQARKAVIKDILIDLKK